MAHRRPISATLDSAATIEFVTADLADAGSLRGCCDGAAVLLHLASEIGADPVRCTRVNIHGTRSLLAEADRAGVRHVIYLSTAAVHGLGPHRELPEDGPVAPVSAASRTRYAGAVVFRPFFVYGEGDRWYIPSLLRRFGGRGRRLTGGLWFDHGSARHSVVAVEDLAAVIAIAAERPDAFSAAMPYHVCEPEAVSLRAVVTALAGLFGCPAPAFSLPWPPVRLLLGAHPALSHAYRRAELLAQDHTYAASRVWAAAGIATGPPMPTRLPRLAPWYQRFMAGLDPLLATAGIPPTDITTKVTG
jgi:nucleoside-diphosphate-sugar epimerase